MRAKPVDSAHSIAATRPTLLFRLRDWSDTTSWSEFYRLYEKLVFGFARRSGLSHADAEEVTQDVFKRVAEKIQDFESNPERGSFRGWLMNLTRWRVTDKFRERQRTSPLRPPPREESGDERTATIERVKDDGAADAAGREWDEEWQRNVLRAAFDRLTKKVDARHFQAFELHVCQGWPVSRIARELRMNTASVYVIHFRLKKLLTAEVAHLKSRMY